LQNSEVEPSAISYYTYTFLFCFLGFSIINQ